MDKSMEERILEDIIRHIYYNRHLTNLGYDTMTLQMQIVFNSLLFKAVRDRNA